jgi:RNA polymerase sigma factor (sigma-70 family)
VGDEVMRMIDETTGESGHISLTPPERTRCGAPEEGLVERARQGDHQAFAALFEAYNARICTYLARFVGDDELGRDLAQDTFIAAWRALPQILGELRFGPWLYRIATNTARSSLRRARLLSWLPFGLENVHALRIPSAGPEPGARLAEAERIRLALATLAPQARICLQCRWRAASHSARSRRRWASLRRASAPTSAADASSSAARTAPWKTRRTETLRRPATPEGENTHEHQHITNDQAPLRRVGELPRRRSR